MRVPPLHVANASLLLLLAAGCAHGTPDTPVSDPRVVATQPALPAAPAPAPAPRVATPAPQAPRRSTPAVAPPVAKTAPPIAQKRTPPSPVLDLAALKAQLRSTKAFGIFTKIALKNQVDDLLDRFRDHYSGKAKVTLAELRQSYDLLLMKVLSLLQDADQTLASAVVSSREAIWGLLADPKTFATLDA